MKNWAKDIKEVLKNNTKNFSIQEKQNVSYMYLNNLLEKMENGLIIENEELKSKIEYVICEMPSKKDEKSISYNTKHLNEITNLQTFVEEKFNLIKEGGLKMRYILLGIPLGMPLGLPFGAAIGKIGFSLIIGIPIGMIIGFLLGNYLDKKAKNENRVL
jgi:hypothetical protein